MAKRKSRLEILRAKVARELGPDKALRDDMPEEIAASLLAEMRQLCPDCGATAAINWKPGARGGTTFNPEPDGLDEPVN